MIRLVVLAPTERPPYERFTFPSFRALLNDPHNRHFIAVAALLDDEPIGLGLAECAAGRGSGQILSVYVAAPYRNQGVGTQLMASLEQQLTHNGCRRCELVWMSGLPSTYAIEKILRKQHWQPPRERMLIFHTDLPTIGKAPWVWNTALPAEYELFPWKKLTAENRTLILESQRNCPWYPEILSPFFEEETLDGVNSVGLRTGEHVVGWQVTHRVRPDTIRYTRLFVHKDYRRLGRSTIALLAASIRWHYESEERHVAPYGIWTVACDNEPMVRFANKHLLPYVQFTQTSWGSVKDL